MSAVAAAAVRRPRRPGRRKITNRALLYLALVFYLAIAIFPLYWMFMAAFKEDVDLIDPGVSPFWFKRPLSLAHFDVLFRQTDFLRWYSNTYLIAAAVLVITLVVCIPGAYALARLHMPGGEHFAIGLFLTYLVPPTLLFLPLSQIVSGGLAMGNNKWALVLVYPTFTVPFCLWLMMGFFKRVPVEIEEAALVDGCNRFQAVLRVVLPVSVPGILTTAIFAFTLAMQDFVYALTFTSSSSQQPLNVGIPDSLIRGDIYFWGELMAAALLAGLPVAILYNFFLDYFVEGITGGALKN
ncbi:MAG TPA: carbohydrate ABC transporter permease [Candidatus Dormibacteraeota bacterium]